MRVQPRVWIGLSVWFGYVIVVATVQRLVDVPYTHLGDSAGTLARGALISLVVGSALLALTAWALGWWRPALLESRPAPSRRPVLAPALMAVAALANLADTRWSSIPLDYLLALAAVGVLVGFAEELTTRGLLLVGLRSRLGEGWVWFVSSFLFGSMHLVNALGGQSLGSSALQALSAFCAGTTLYILRRVTGSLVWSMALHGLWDFSVFAVAHAPSALGALPGVVTNYVACALGLIALAWVVRPPARSPASDGDRAATRPGAAPAAHEEAGATVQGHARSATQGDVPPPDWGDGQATGGGLPPDSGDGQATGGGLPPDSGDGRATGEDVPPPGSGDGQATGEDVPPPGSGDGRASGGGFLPTRGTGRPTAGEDFRPATSEDTRPVVQQVGPPLSDRR